MNFLEIEYKKVNQSVNMSYMQFHDYYELYFLLSGKREIFVENKLFLLEPNCMYIIPPFSMHKTEGSAYERINIYISKSMMTASENAFLQKLCEQTVFILQPKQMQFIVPILKETAAAQIADRGKRNNFLLAFTKAVLAYLQNQPLMPLAPSSVTQYTNKSYSVILQVVAFINKEYSQHITLDLLHKKFYVSKNTLCKQFQKQMGCSLIQYVTHTRINKAKMHLSTTNKKISEIAELCGFPSANYLGLVFKKQVGISPMDYRKKQ